MRKNRLFERACQTLYEQLGRPCDVDESWICPRLLRGRCDSSQSNAEAMRIAVECWKRHQRHWQENDDRMDHQDETVEKLIG